MWNFSLTGFYDNQYLQLIHPLSDYDVFLILADAANNDQKLFGVCEEASIHLVTQVNMRRAKFPDSFQSLCRKQNWYDVHQGKKLLKKQNWIESLFPTLKTLYGLEQPKLYGLLRHVLWVINV